MPTRWRPLSSPNRTTFKPARDINHGLKGKTMRRQFFCIATCAALLLSGQALHAQTTTPISPAPTHQQWCKEALSANQWQHNAIVAHFDQEFARIEAERS